MSFALYRRPGGVIFLDDDPDYLETVAEVMPPEWYVRLFLRPVSCIETMRSEPAAWEADAWRHQEIINHWREGAALIPQILQYWRDDRSARFALTRVCVVDYSMPAMSGLRVLGELTAWSGSRILLTGRADEQLAVSAFNRGLIDQFIPKQSPDIRQHLVNAIEGMLRKPDQRSQQTWRSTLSREQHAMLCDPDISQQLEALAVKHGWVEHVVIGAPFGVLALDGKGRAAWLQLEPAHKLAELAEIAGAEGWDAATVQDVADGKKVIDMELQQALGGGLKPRQQEATALASESAAPLYTALFPIAENDSPGAAGSYERFIADRGERTLQD